MTAQTFTPESAQVFGGYSAANAAYLAACADRRGCSCAPYRDWFTYRRWAAMGFQVKRGEHGERLGVFVQSDVLNDAGEVVGHRSRPWSAVVFCRCQVMEG